MIRSESFRAGLRRSYLDRRPVVNQPTVFLESLRSNEFPFHKLSTAGIHVWSRHSCATISRNEGRSLFLVECRAGKSPALTGPLSTGDRRQHRIRWTGITELRPTPMLTAGEKGAYCLEVEMYSDRDLYEYDPEEQDEEEDEFESFDCHLDRSGYCGKAGSEECEFECPYNRLKGIKN